MDQKRKEKPAILLVDDHPNNLIALEAVLGTSDYHLVNASSGAEALALLDQYDFALVLLDIQMPEMDGYEVARRMKSSERNRHVPIILITAVYREDPHVQMAYEVGAVEYFSKPFNPSILRLKVGIYADLYRTNLVLRRKEEERRTMERKLIDLSQTLEEREKERRHEEERRGAELRTILESIPDAIYVGDENGITRCNASALSMFGFDTCEQMNQHFETLAGRIQMRYPGTGDPIPPNDQPFSHALRGEHYVSEVTIRHLSTGKELTIACAAAPVVLDEKIIGAVVINMNVPAAIRETWKPEKWSGYQRQNQER